MSDANRMTDRELWKAAEEVVVELTAERDRLAEQVKAFQRQEQAVRDFLGLKCKTPEECVGCGCQMIETSCAVFDLTQERDRFASELAVFREAVLPGGLEDGTPAQPVHALAMRERNDMLVAENAQLREWKRQMLAVESDWDEQSLAKMLGVPLGESCRKGIAERMPLVLKELVELRAACEPFAKWWQETVDNTTPSALENAARRPIAYDGRYHGPTLGDCRRIAALLARTPHTETPL